MNLKTITRVYSRSLSFKRPDGTEMWIRHEMSASADLEEGDNAKAVGDGLEEIVRKEVGASINAEKKLILASFNKVDEPFPGKMPGQLPKL